MTRDDRLMIARWLRRFQGHEILQDFVLDHLAEFGVRYSRIENVLLYGTVRVAAGVLTRADVYARFSHLDAEKFFLAPGSWHGVLVVDLAQSCCALAGLGDPARGERGTHSRFSAYLKALTEERHGESQDTSQEDQPS